MWHIQLRKWVRWCLLLVFIDARCLEAAICIWTSVGFSLLAASGSGRRPLPRSCREAGTFLKWSSMDCTVQLLGTQKHCCGAITPLISPPAWFQRGDEEQGPNFCHWLIRPESPSLCYMSVYLKFWSAQVWLNMQNAPSDCGCILSIFWLPLVGSKSINLWKSKILDRLTQGLCLVHDHSMNSPVPQVMEPVCTVHVG